MSDFDVKAGDTEPITFTVELTGVSDLDDLSTAELYAREISSSTNHVDGAPCTVHDSEEMELAFDPVDNGPGDANAFAIGDEGDYDVYVKLTWADGDTTRHPGFGFRRWTVGRVFES